MQVRLEIRVVRAVGNLAQIKGRRADTFNIGRSPGDLRHHIERALRFGRYRGHAETHHRTIEGRRGGRNDFLAFVSQRSLANTNRAGSTHRKIRQSQRRSVHDRKDRLCGALVVEFE